MAIKSITPIKPMTSLVSALSIVLLLTIDSSAQERAGYRGRRVIDVLTQLQQDGARIIYSSSLVIPALVVKAEPKGRTPRQVASEVLAEHGLALKDGPGGIWLVIRAPTNNPAGRSRADGSASKGSTLLRPARADEPARPPEDPQELPRIEEQVDVTQRPGEFAAEPTVRSVDVSAVRETAGGLENVFQVLSLLPGVAATDDEEGKIAVRGAGPQHNMIVFDGVQMHNPQRYGEFTSSFINPATAASIALDASGLDARYGGRLSSVTVLETRDGRTDRKFALSGSAGLTNGDLLAEGRLPRTQSGSWWATVRGTYYRFVADRFEDGVMPSFADLQFKISLRPTPRTRLSIVGLVGQEAMRDPLPHLLTDQVDGPILQEFKADNRLAAANLRWTPGRRLTTITTVTGYSNAARFQDHWKTDSGNIDFRGPFDRRVHITDYGVRQRAIVSWSAHHALDTGVEVHRLRNTWVMIGKYRAPWYGTVGPNVWGELIPDTHPIDLHMARTQVGAWLQERIPLGAGIDVEPGVRIDWNSFTREHALQPRLRVSKRLGDATTIWTGLSWQAQTPGLETMQQGFQFFDFASPEAINIRNERSRQVVVGLERPLRAGITLRAEAYSRWLDRLLVQRQETEAEHAQRLSGYDIPPDLPPDSVFLEYRPTVHPQSVGIGRATGLELLVQRDRGRVSGWLAYTLSKSERELYGRTVPFDFDRRHALAAAAQVQIASHFRASATWQFASGFPTTPATREVYFHRRTLPDGSWDPVLRTSRYGDGRLLYLPVGYPFRITRYNDIRMQHYARTDVRFTYTLGERWEFYGEILNVFNRENFTDRLMIDEGSGPAYSSERGIYESFGRLLTYGVRVKF